MMAEKWTSRVRVSNLAKQGCRYKPLLEGFEDRVLPGETLGMFLFPGSILAEMGGPAENPPGNDGTTVLISPARPLSSPTPPTGYSENTLLVPNQESNRHGQENPHQVSDQVFAGNSFGGNIESDSNTLLGELTSALNHPQTHRGITNVSAATGSVVHAGNYSNVISPSFHGTSGENNTFSSSTRTDRSFRENLVVGIHGAGTTGYWGNYGHDPQHTGIADRASQSLTGILWQSPVDTNPPSAGNTHYASPVITASNTVIFGVNTHGSNFFRVEAHDGYTGALKWSVNTDYQMPSSGWVPPLPMALTAQNRLYFAGAGATVYYIDNPDDDGAGITGQLAFYDIQNYNHSFDNRIYINTPLTPDANGSIYFGFLLTNNVLNLQSGIARMDFDGSGIWVSARVAAGGDSGVTNVITNCAPALSNDQSALYVTVTGVPYLVEVDTASLSPLAQVRLRDVGIPTNDATLTTLSTASPTVGPDGDVYIGVLENPFPQRNDRGWLLHFNSDLSQAGIPGGFGWDDTASIVPSYMVPSYQGPSSYLVMTKYNNYAGFPTGDGSNKIAILDPNVGMPDPYTSGAIVMNEVLTILGPTLDQDWIRTYPDARREWCINAAAVDPYTSSILVNSEDGHMYRWDMTTNTLSEGVSLNPAFSEPYTPTLVGPDGTVYAINHGILYALGTV